MKCMARPSKGAQKAAYDAAFKAEHARTRGEEHVQVLTDLVKAFELVPHARLIEAAQTWGYPLWLLRLSLDSYRVARTMTIECNFPEWSWPPEA